MSSVVEEQEGDHRGHKGVSKGMKLETESERYGPRSGRACKFY